ncbi:hypothetical protein F511_28743 [Dorcoceras hygrometricum]|uniref:Uncharacterized protein n=1 Tax=Dorcoceras hygrometricum TaxID=472368 RepID=A0A2Z7DFY5_9LAMI|nr:hypothetical protein F511_28743 [Dorcoceras hygrometricum]
MMMHLLFPPPPQMTPYERASVDLLAGITKIQERQSERSRKSHEEDVAERFRNQGPKEIAGTTDPLVAERDPCFGCHYPCFARLRTTHSFISSAFTQRMCIIPESLGVALAKTVPSGEELTTTNVVQLLTTMFQDHVVRADLIVLLMSGFDHILGMDWLTEFGVVIDFQRRQIGTSDLNCFILSNLWSRGSLVVLVHEACYLNSVTLCEGIRVVP